ncbi:autotransporter domain-containing protein [Rhizobium sp. NRK18]|uniref:autotransporter outer membrane beta-barrel domain-containing protein n=1 Tax=Rhizobium sp. NRK18 TaxID=2964667 RepID=UPI0021C2972D|nr:autotransporter domain-containing protein [Rhizobium sp. NRK18]MCQ2004904.1 autotransporter domain-containing protein [Rhizobium sp. NRK18]
MSKLPSSSRVRALLSTTCMAAVPFAAQLSLPTYGLAEPVSSICSTSGNVTSSNCDDGGYISMIGGVGTSTLTVTGGSASAVYIGTYDEETTPTAQTLRITGGTVINNTTYSAVYFSTDAADHDATIIIDAGVTITADGGGFGAEWFRNATSGDITVDSAATVTAYVGPGISASTNDGSISLTNSGSVTSTTNWGLYADGGKFSTETQSISITNSGTVNGYLAGIRAIGYVANTSVTNSGTVYSTTRQAITAWSDTGTASVTNSGTVTAYDEVGLQAWGATGVTVVNSGTVYAYDNDELTDQGVGHNGIHTLIQGFGTTTITNTKTGVIYAPDDAAISATAQGSDEEDIDGGGDINIVNAGSVTGADGIEATTLNGKISITNTGTITGLTSTGVTLSQTASLDNSGTINGEKYGVYLEGSGNTISNTGSITGGIASVYFASGSNTLNISPSSFFSGVVDYNETTGNTTNFGAGSYRVEASNYLSGLNTINLDNDGQTLIITNADTTGTINVVALPSASKMATQYTSSVSDVVGSILALDVARPDSVQVDMPGTTGALGYAETKADTAAVKAIKSQTGDLALDGNGNLFWMRAFGGQKFLPGDDGQTGSESFHYGAISGVDHQFDKTRLGMFMGGGHVSSKADDGTSSITGNTGFFGFYGAQQMQGFQLDASIAFGGIRNRSKRSINNGEENAVGSFNGWYASPEIALSTSRSLADDWTLTGRAKLRYTGAWYESYDESGSSQNIDYDSRTSQSLEGRLMGELTKRTELSTGQPLTFTLTGAVSDVQYLGSDSIHASLDNTEFSVADSGARNVAGVGIGANIDVQVRSNVSVYGGVEGWLYTDKSKAYSGRMGVKVAF